MNELAPRKNARLFIGVDGGGTGCRARIEDAEGRVLGTGIAGPAAVRLGMIWSDPDGPSARRRGAAWRTRLWIGEERVARRPTIRGLGLTLSTSPLARGRGFVFASIDE
jgi:hypothetical protein